MSPSYDPTASNSGTASPRCAVVVSSRNRGEKIAALVESVLRSDERDFEFVLVDQSDNDETQTAIQRFLSDRRLRTVRSDQRGASRGRNLGISHTTAPIIAITDDDCMVPPEWITQMMAPFAADPRVGVTFCNVDPVPVEELGMTPQIQFPECRTLVTPEDGWASAKRRSVLGAGMAVRRTAIEALGGFDDLLGPGSSFPSGEDNDLMWRALARNWSVHHTNKTAVLHDGFRKQNDLRELIKRDLWGAGGSMAKFLKAGYWGVVPPIANISYKLGIRDPLQDIRARRLPRGFKRPYWLMDAISHGLRIPIDITTLTYRVAGENTDRVNRGRANGRPGAQPAPR
jgi:glycosyltransferase involved in cell wall biosynthesis